MSSDRPPRPGDPDGSLFERVLFEIGFLCWLLAVSVLALLGKLIDVFSRE